LADEVLHPSVSTPVPDPTVLTTEALQREIKGVRELLEMRVNSLQHLMDSQSANRVELVNEKFRKVSQEFELVERQRVEQKTDTKSAVDAALIAQKEAVKEQTIAQGTAIAKSEAGTAEQLKALRSEFTTSIFGVSSSLGDLKDRIVAIESMRLGSKENQAAVYAIIGLLATLIIVSVTVVGFVIALNN